MGIDAFDILTVWAASAAICSIMGFAKGEFIPYFAGGIFFGPFALLVFVILHVSDSGKAQKESGYSNSSNGGSSVAPKIIIPIVSGVSIAAITSVLGFTSHISGVSGVVAAVLGLIGVVSK